MPSMVGMGDNVNTDSNDEECDRNEGVKVEGWVATHSGATISRLLARPLKPPRLPATPLRVEPRQVPGITSGMLDCYLLGRFTSPLDNGYDSILCVTKLVPVAYPA